MALIPPQLDDMLDGPLPRTRGDDRRGKRVRRRRGLVLMMALTTIVVVAVLGYHYMMPAFDQFRGAFFAH